MPATDRDHGEIERLEVLRCPREQWLEALLVQSNHMHASLIACTASRLHQEAERGEIDLSGLWIACQDREILGTMLSLELPGGTAAVWPPRIALSRGGDRLGGVLVRTVLERLRARGFRIAQALLDPADADTQERYLVGAGFARITELAYLTRRIGKSPPSEAFTAEELEWVSLEDGSEVEFGEVLEQTYIDTLDMPELGGTRTFQVVLSAHEGRGRLMRSQWWLGRSRRMRERAGLVFLSCSDDPDTWELTYLGLTPAARGRGLGRVFLSHAVEQARRNVGWLRLAVDLRNTPACRLYNHGGFWEYERRRVYLARLVDEAGAQRGDQG